MTRIAWFTPYPPEHSAIAQYSILIVQELISRGISVDLWIDADTTGYSSDLVLKVYNYGKHPELKNQLSKYDVIIYNMGNHLENHEGIFETAVTHPGIVIVHDYVLHHFFAAYFLSKRASPDGYISAMQFSHGEEGARIAREQLSRVGGPPIWETDSVIDFPLSRPALVNALAVVTHSQFTKNALSNFYNGPIAKIDFPSTPNASLVYATKEELGIQSDKTVLLTIGDVNPNKRIDKVIHAIARSQHLKESVVYVVIGKVSRSHFDAEATVYELGLEHAVKILGRQPDEVVNKYLSIADIGVNLRFPTMGESSWTLQQMMNLGIPCIVTDVGSYAEVPDDCVCKIGLENEDTLLQKCLEAMVHDEDLRMNVGKNGREYAKTVFSTQKYCDDLLSLCDVARDHNVVNHLVDKVSSELREIGINHVNGVWMVDLLSTEIGHLQARGAKYVSSEHSTRGNSSALDEAAFKQGLLKFTQSTNSAPVSAHYRDGVAVKVPHFEPNHVRIGDLVEQDSWNFVESLYRILLKREPDETGFLHHLALLNRGASKKALIYMFARSEEAANKGVSSDGLERLKWAYYSYRFKALVRRVPILNWLISIVKVPKRAESLRQDLALFLSGYDYKVQQLEQRIRRSLEEEVSALRGEMAQWRETNELLLCELRHLAANVDDVNSNVDEVNSATERMSLQLTNAMEHMCLRLTNIEQRCDSTAVSCANNIVVTRVDEFIVGLPAEEWRMVGYMTFKGQLEPGLVKLFRSYVKPGMVVADVGANIGMYTLLGASLVGPTGKVHSFEPTPRTFEILRNNVQVNGYLESGIVVFHRNAVSDTTGTAEFTVYNANSGHNTLYPDDSNYGEVTVVERTTLDVALFGETRVDVVKIDVEGSEPFVLRGMREVIDRNPDITIFMEFAPPNLRQAGVDVYEFINQIEGYGFTIFKVDDISGDIIGVDAGELTKSFSVNLVLRRV